MSLIYMYCSILMVPGLPPAKSH